MYNNEKDVANRAVQMLETSVRQKASSFADHVNRQPEQASLKDVTAKATLKTFGTRRSGNRVQYLKRLSIRMGRHGFIQNYGVDTIRSGGTRTRQRPREITYGFRSHVMKLEAKPFIKEAIEQSGVIDFVLENITRIRSEEIIVNVRRIMENS